jgi:hypothetical protein
MTAVEWLEQEIFRKYKFTLQQLNCQPLEEAIQQAKEMEKQQIIDAVEWDYKSNMGEVYYNATYKNNKL